MLNHRISAPKTLQADMARADVMRQAGKW